MKVYKVVVHFEEVDVDEKDIVTISQASELSGLTVQDLTNRVARVDRSKMATALPWYQDSKLPTATRYTSRKGVLTAAKERRK